jgi:hypothetical protein
MRTSVMSFSWTGPPETSICGAFIESASIKGTHFEPLRDPSYFREVRIELGAVAWPNGADLAPDAMYDAIRASGHWVVAA